MATDDNDLILSRLRGAPVQYMTRLEMMMSGLSVQRMERNDNSKERLMRAELEAAVEAMRNATKAVEDCKYKLNSFELLDGSSPLVRVDWRPRSETPPKGRVWASDGDGVWLISCDGHSIPSSATAVKFWTAALIPLPPNAAKIIDGELALPALANQQ